MATGSAGPGQDTLVQAEDQESQTRATEISRQAGTWASSFTSLGSKPQNSSGPRCSMKIGFLGKFTWGKMPVGSFRALERPVYGTD